MVKKGLVIIHKYLPKTEYLIEVTPNIYMRSVLRYKQSEISFIFIKLN